MHFRAFPMITAIAATIPLTIYISISTASAFIGGTSGILFSLLFLFVFDDEYGDVVK
jgi:hypothetical protein